MLNKELLDALNEQMNHEYFAAHAYMAMAAFCDSKSYEGFANFYIQQAKKKDFMVRKFMITSMIVVNKQSLIRYQHLNLNSQVS